MEIYEVIREARIKRGIEQPQVARVLGVSVNFVSLMERGESKIPLDKLWMLMKYYGLKKDAVVKIMVKTYRDFLNQELA